MDEFLIEQVRKHEVLYNIQSKNYRDQGMRQTAWEEVGKDLKIKANVAKTTWNKLRRSFLMSKNKRRNKRSGEASKNIPWKFENQMAFLLPYIEIRKSTNIEEKYTRERDDEKIDVEEDARGDNLMNDVGDVHDNEIIENEDSQLLHSENHTDQAISLEKNEEILDEPIILKRKKGNEPKNVMQEMVQIMKQSLELRQTRHASKQSTRTDETDIFFLSMSKTTKTLPVVEQARIKLAVSSAVFHAQLRVHDKREYFPYSRPPSRQSMASSSSVHS